MDSGSFTTAGSLEHRSRFCKQLRPVRGEVNMKLPSGQIVPAVKAGIMDIQASYEGKHILFGNTLVFMVSNPS